MNKPSTKRCRNCRKPFVSRHQSRTKLGWTIFCSRECANSWRHRSSLSDASTTRHCEVCQCVLVRRSDETPKRFLARVTCCPKCKFELCARKRRKAAIPRKCEVCDNEFWRRPHEKPCEFAKRITCSDGCKSTSAMSRARTYDVLGVRLTQRDLAKLFDVGVSCICVRLKRGGISHVFNLIREKRK